MKKKKSTVARLATSPLDESLGSEAETSNKRSVRYQKRGGLSTAYVPAYFSPGSFQGRPASEQLVHHAQTGPFPPPIQIATQQRWRGTREEFEECLPPPPLRCPLSTRSMQTLLSLCVVARSSSSSLFLYPASLSLSSSTISPPPLSPPLQHQTVQPAQLCHSESFPLEQTARVSPFPHWIVRSVFFLFPYFFSSARLGLRCKRRISEMFPSLPEMPVHKRVTADDDTKLYLLV